MSPLILDGEVLISLLMKDTFILESGLGSGRFIGALCWDMLLVVWERDLDPPETLSHKQPVEELLET
jgi:hypothetical protein